MTDEPAVSDGGDADADADGATVRGDVGTAVGDGLGKVGGWILMLPVAIVGRAVHEGTKTAMGVATILPLTSPWASLTKWGIHKLHKSAGGDAVGLVHEPNGTIEPVPVKYKEQDVDEEEAERAGWHEFSGDRSWHEGADGREVDRFGKTPVVLLDSATTQRATTTEARFAQALDLDQTDRLVQLSDEGQVDITVEMTDSAPSGARADGGMTWQAVEQSIRGAVMERALVDIGADGHDGMRLDPRKVKETYREKTGGEQLDEVERLGFLAGQLGEEDRTGFIIKVLLIALGFVAAALIGPDLLSQASNSGGAALPLTLGSWGL